MGVGGVYRLPLELVGEGFVVLGGEGLDGLLLGAHGEQRLQRGDRVPPAGQETPAPGPGTPAPPLPPHLVPPQLEGDGDVDGVVHDAHHGAHQRHEEQREPDDGHEEEDDEPPHAVLHDLLLLLPLGLGVFLGGGRQHTVPGGLRGTPRNKGLLGGPFPARRGCTFSVSRLHLMMKTLA